VIAGSLANFRVDVGETFKQTGLAKRVDREAESVVGRRDDRAAT
jgi:hypothetical protein